MNSGLNQQKRENLQKIVTLIEENADKIASFLRDGETVGRLGIQKPVAPEKTKEELTEQIQSTCDDIRGDLEEADEVWQVIVRFLNQSGFGEMVKVDRELSDEVEKIPDILIFSIVFLNSYVISADEYGGTNFQEVQTEFLEDLIEQGKLGDANSATIEYWLKAGSKQQAVAYFNTLMTTARLVLSELKPEHESTEQNVSEFVDVYREASTIYEDVLPIVTAIYKSLENEDVIIENIERMGPRDCKRQLETFPPLAPYVEHYDIDIRNAVSHGGNSGVILNNMAGVVVFQYKEGEEQKEKQMDFDEFCKKTLRTTSASVSLLVLPLFLIYMEGFMEIRDGILESL